MPKRKHSRQDEEETEITLREEMSYDVLSLNIGGTRLDVLRRTLCLVEDSMLAAKFSGRWDEGLPMDKDGNFFVDEPYELFKTLVDFLRVKSREIASDPTFGIEDYDCVDAKVVNSRAFQRTVDYYVCTIAVYPLGIQTYSKIDTVRVTEWPETIIETKPEKVPEYFHEFVHLCYGEGTTDQSKA